MTDPAPEIVVRDHEVDAELLHHTEETLKLRWQNYTGVVTVDLELPNNRITLTKAELEVILAKTLRYETAAASLKANEL